MKFVNLKTCQGLESHVFVEGALVRLSELPEVLRDLEEQDLRELFRLIENKNRKRKPALTASLS